MKPVCRSEGDFSLCISSFVHYLVSFKLHGVLWFNMCSEFLLVSWSHGSQLDCKSSCFVVSPPTIFTLRLTAALVPDSKQPEAASAEQPAEHFTVTVSASVGVSAHTELDNKDNDYKLNSSLKLKERFNVESHEAISKQTCRPRGVRQSLANGWDRFHFSHLIKSSLLTFSWI